MKKRLLWCLMILLLLPAAALSLSASPAGEEQTFTSGYFTAVDLGDGTCELIESQAGYSDVFTIPSELEGKRVVGIGESVFEQFWNVRVMIIPEGVQYIADRAFYGCEDSWNMKLPEGLVSIGKEAFQYCHWSKLEIPEGVKRIGKGAFSCSSVEEITLPASLSEMGNNPFACNWYIESFQIAAGNPVFHMEGNLLIDQVHHRLVAVTQPQQEIVIPDGIECIDDDVFCSSEGVERIVIPQSVGHIGPDTFGSCDDLRSVEILGRDTIIDGEAFAECEALEEIRGYAGTVAQKLAENLGVKFTAIEGDARLQKMVCGDYIALDLGDGSCEISRYTGYGGNLCVPDTLNGKQVVRIGKNAFSGSKVANVALPYGLLSIGDYAFSDCAYLQYLMIPETVTEIGKHSLQGTMQYTIAGGAGSQAQHTAEENGANFAALSDTKSPVLPHAFACGVYTALDYGNGTCAITGYSAEEEEAIIPDVLDGRTVVAIMDGTFEWYQPIRVVFPQSMTSISDSVLQGIQCAAIPDSMHFSANPFHRYSDEDVQVELYAAGEGWLHLEDNLLIDGNGCLIDAYAPEGELVIPDTVTSIGDGALKNCVHLTGVKLPEGLTSIGAEAFMDCEDLEYINLPDSLKEIGDQAFSGCWGLESVTTPDEVVSIDMDTFYKHWSLERIINYSAE